MNQRKQDRVMLSSEGWHRLGPSFEGESAGSGGARRLPVEWMVGSSRRTFQPPFDVFETDGDIVIKVEIAGMREDDFRISVDGRILRISGEREDVGGKLAYQRMEINYGQFRVDIRLPAEVDQARIEARYDRGFLCVRVPRRQRRTRVTITQGPAS